MSMVPSGDDISDIQWIREALERIEGRLDREKSKRDVLCKEESSRLGSLEKWRAMLVGAWIVLLTETTVTLGILGLIAKG